MSLIGQIRLLVAAIVTLAFIGSVTVSMVSTRDLLQTQLGVKNADNAQSLALAMSQHGGDRQVLELLLAAQFDTGTYRRITFTPADGSAAFRRESEARAGSAPRWFAALAPIESTPGVAQVSDGWRSIGAVHVVSHGAYAHDELWRIALRSAALLALVGFGAAVAATFAIRRIQQPLDATVAQAGALVDGRYVQVAEPGAPELQRVARAMNSMVARVRAQFEAQAQQVEAWRRRAHSDPLTGLAHRRQFLAQLSSLLQREDGAAEGGLVLLRLCDLAGLNTSLGRDATDRALRALAEVLDEEARRGGGCPAGRLNGSDFALALPVPGLAVQTAQALAQTLRAALAAFGPQVMVAFGAVEMHRGATPSTLLAVADAALACAESGEPFGVELGELPGERARPLGEQAWRQQIGEALAQRRARLAEFPIIDRHARPIALDCPLRVQLEPCGAFEVAAHWLPLAMRSRLTAAVDEHAVQLALQAIARDGRVRCVNLSPASLADIAFAGHLHARLAAEPRAARSLWLEVAESAVIEHFDRVQEFGRQLRPLGVRFGLEHAGVRLAQVERLYEAGLDYVKLDIAVTAGVASDVARAAHVSGIIAMLHGLSLQVIAEGVSDAQDAGALWSCGLDAVTGPWASAQAGLTG